jgi:hypothetical protein
MSGYDELLFDEDGLTLWRKADGTFQFCVGKPHDFRSVTLSEGQAMRVMGLIRLAGDWE